MAPVANMKGNRATVMSAGTTRATAATSRIEAIENRVLLAAVVPTDYEQYMIELINRARANPGAEAARIGVDLNEGIPAGTITTDPKQPLDQQRFLRIPRLNHPFQAGDRGQV